MMIFTNIENVRAERIALKQRLTAYKREIKDFFFCLLLYDIVFKF